jgi:nucleoside-diphosphate-sugar epimerase
MKNLLITGCNGYVARNIAKHLTNYNITLTERANLNLLDSEQTKNFFKDKYFDAVIHTATSGGSRLAEDENEVFYKNCLMHQNLLENSASFDKYISFGSGAELDRRYNIDESAELKSAYPIDPYGMSKNFIAKSGLMYPNFYNIRIFNVFNYDELPTRMVKSNIINYLKQEPIVIHQDKYMDFFFMEDLCKVVKFVIDSDVKQKIINCSYKEKYKLSDIANIINNLSFYDVEIIVENNNMGLNYFGDYNLHLFDVNLSGLHLGLVDTYELLRNKTN